TPPTQTYTLSLHDALPIFTDLKTDAQKKGWSDVIHSFVTDEISMVSGCTGAAKVQFIDPLVRDLGNDRRTISWPAFPISLLAQRSEEHTSELQSLAYLVCR